MYKIKVNGKYSFELNDKKGIHPSSSIELDIQAINDNYVHILYKNKSYSVELLKHDVNSKELIVLINGREYQLKIQDEYDELLHKLGLDKALSCQISELNAPMPGLVLNTLVKEGDTVAKGDSLLILEAMKMENIIKSPVDGVVKLMKIKVGDKLEKNQAMITFQ